MALIDSALLDLTERVCQWFQRMTGRTNVWLAVQLTNLSIIIYFIWAAAVFRFLDAWLRVAVVLFWAALFYGLSQTVFRVPIETAESNAYRRVAKGLRNPRRVRDALLRISFLTLSALMVAPTAVLYTYGRAALNASSRSIALLSYSLIVLTTVLLYVLACDPLPPCRGKVREWLREGTPARAVAEPQ